VRAQAGAVATQNITDPALGALGLELLARGQGAAAVLRELVAATPYAAFRQLAVIDAGGATAYHAGAYTLGVHAVAEGRDSIACGNLLAHADVPRAMVARYAASAGAPLAERLLGALRAGLDAGGEAGPVRSAGLYVVDRHVWPIADLRVDWHDDPVAELEELWSVYAPQMNDYVLRAIDPARAPGYGVPGES
jgi:uncharacterized Ntn-hydrolase superfamily protein